MRAARLFYHPVKSLAGVETDRLELTRRGPKWDREWMLVGPDGAFLSQRTHPRMGRIRPSLSPSSLRLSAADSDLEIPLDTEGPRRRVTVWDDPCEAVDQGDEAAEWLSSFIRTPCRLVRIAPGFRRSVGGNGDWTAFADGYPLLVVNEASLADLGRRAGREFEAERFRPNVVLSRAEPWAEDGWKALRAKGLTLRVVKPCARCSITTLDPATGEGGPEPLRTLATFRRGEEGVEFGVNCAPEGDGALKAGDVLFTVPR